MSRVVEELADFNPLLKRMQLRPPDPVLHRKYRGTELITCPAEGCTCGVVVAGPLDIEVTLELVDNLGWVYARPRHYCPAHRAQAHDSDEVAW